MRTRRGERELGATLDIIFTQPDGAAIAADFDRSQTLENAVHDAASTHTGLPVEGEGRPWAVVFLAADAVWLARSLATS